MTIEIFNDNWPFNSEIKQNSLLYLFYLINDSQIIIKFSINKYIYSRYYLTNNYILTRFKNKYARYIIFFHFI